MRLNPIQWAWMVAAIAYFIVLLVDVADLLAVPNPVLILGGLLLALVSRAVGPSMTDITRTNRRG